jgi:hypothetical protein
MEKEERQITFKFNWYPIHPAMKYMKNFSHNFQSPAWVRLSKSHSYGEHLLKEKERKHKNKITQIFPSSYTMLWHITQKVNAKKKWYKYKHQTVSHHNGTIMITQIWNVLLWLWSIFLHFYLPSRFLVTTHFAFFSSSTKYFFFIHFVYSTYTLSHTLSDMISFLFLVWCLTIWQCETVRWQYSKRKREKVFWSEKKRNLITIMMSLE